MRSSESSNKKKRLPATPEVRSTAGEIIGMAVFAIGWGLLAAWLGVVIAGAEIVVLSLAAGRTPAPPADFGDG